MMTTAGSFLDGSGSAVASEVRRLSAIQRRILGLSESALLIWEILVVVAAALTDDTDERPWELRLEQVVVGFMSPDDDAAQTALEQFVGFSEKDLPAWLKSVRKEDTQRFLRRGLGAAAYDRLAAALRRDGAVLVVAGRRGSRLLMPYAVALDDVAAVLSPQQIADCAPFVGVQGTLVRLALQIDEGLDQLIGLGLVLEAASARPDEASAISVADFDAFVGQLRAVVSGRSRTAVGNLSEALARKMQGARDAIEHSADPVSQASSSLIELIDRLLRTAFSDEEVLAWSAANYGSRPDLTHERDGSVRPTKRAQALCFAYAGQPVGQGSAVHDLLALSIVATRTRLQQLKHADTGAAEEAAAVGQYLAAVEGSLQVALGLAWAMLPDDQLERLRSRF